MRGLLRDRCCARLRHLFPLHRRRAKEKGWERWTISSSLTARCTAKACRWPRSRPQVGTPVYVYSTATMVRHAAVMRGGAGALARSAHRLCGQGQSQCRGAGDARPRRPRRRHRLGRRISPAPAPPASASDKIVFSGRRQDRAGDGRGAEGRPLPVQPRIARGGGDARRRSPPRSASPRRSASASIRTSRPAPTPRSRPAPPTTSSASRSTPRSPPIARAARSARPRGPGRRRPYRQPAHRSRPARSGLQPRRRADRRAARAPAIRSRSPISAAASAFPTIPPCRTRRARTIMARWCGASPAAGTSGWCSSRAG